MWTITLDRGAGSGGTEYIFEDGSCNWFSDWAGTSSLGTSITPPTPVGGFKFTGYASQSDGGVWYTDSTGKILDALKSKQFTSDATLYAQYTRVLWTMTLDARDGEGGTVALFYKISGGGWYFDTSLELAAGAVSVPHREGYKFLGYYSAASGGKQWIDENGGFLLAMPTPTSDRTAYAQWKARVERVVTLDADGGSGSPAAIYKKSDGTTIYADEACTQAITSIVTPTKPGKTFRGFYNSTSGSTQYVTAAGAFSSNLTALTTDKTIYAKWQTVSSVLYLDADGGSGGLAMIFCKNSAWYSDEACTQAVASITRPTRSGYTFGGYKVGSTVYVAADGAISASSISADTTATAVWTAKTYVIGFDYNGGGWSAPYTTQKTVTFGQAVGELPTVTPPARRTFEAWFVGSTAITATTVWNIDSNVTAVAKWEDFFGDLTDWFGLDVSNRLMLVGSENGEGRLVTNLWNGSYQQGGALLNPVCTYRIKASGRISIRLGKAFAAGYMITEVEYQTGADREPLLVVRGTANEGADAINHYDVTIWVDPDHVAQDPLSAVAGGGELLEMTTTATCDAVVPYENNAPCASDIVHGRLKVSGRTAAYQGESKPTFNNSFIGSGEPKSESDVDFTTYSFSAEKGL